MQFFVLLKLYDPQPAEEDYQDAEEDHQDQWPQLKLRNKIIIKLRQSMLILFVGMVYLNTDLSYYSDHS